jgi:UDP-glucose 4-epimerase
MRVLVTGGAGFIGSHVATGFAAAGHEVLALDNLSRGRRENLPAGVSLAVADVRDRAALEKVFAEFRPEAVDHHAAQVSVRDSVADPAADAEINVIGGLRLLETCVAHQVPRFLFASTGGAIYGEQERFPADESHPAAPLAPYGIAKLAVEKYLYFYEVTYGLKWTALRYSNVYGPRQDPHGEAGVVAIITERMLTGRKATINGDGGQTRDFVYVADVARANLLALERGATGPINIGTGLETSINDVFGLLREFTGAQLDERHGPAKPGEQRRSVLDPARAKQLLGWEPTVDVREGLARTVEYFRGHKQ